LVGDLRQEALDDLQEKAEPDDLWAWAEQDVPQEKAVLVGLVMAEWDERLLVMVAPTERRPWVAGEE